MGIQIKTIYLRSLIRELLEEHCSTVHYRQAKRAEGLHVVFRIDDFRREEVMKVLTLDVRVVDQGKDTDAVEDLADEIWDAFDHLYYLDDHVEFTIYQNTRSIVDEEDASVIHRRLLFEIRAL